MVCLSTRAGVPVLRRLVSKPLATSASVSPEEAASPALPTAAPGNQAAASCLQYGCSALLQTQQLQQSKCVSMCSCSKSVAR